MFLCPMCNSKLNGFIPEKCICGYEIPKINGIYQFTSDAPIQLDSENKYIGYEYIGENFEPESMFRKQDPNGHYGVYETCSDQLVEIYGKGTVVLDLGAGLGSASVPLAKAGAAVIAADISNNMLTTIMKRAGGMYDNLICVRMNAYHLYIEDNSIDVVVENAMLHLVDHPEDVIHEICRVLKPKGVLVRYGPLGFQLTEEQQKIHSFCNTVLNDIESFYGETLKELGFNEIWFDNHFHDIMLRFFEQPYNVMTQHMEEFSEKMKYRLYRLQTKAISGLQHVPNHIHLQAWNKTETYAIDKYGEDFRNIPSYSRYGAVLDVYKVKK